ncbi:Metallo-dependent phosphatase [Saitoella complicata NRRL Y-17804]|uniref:Calcineurin-like phosphoesterase domain-containing protein n=1 Tax=Saitoella complicata (strain BCRC 22490 / CBS 7301 / JCM 7358 / NBRC 10748 / NRRL Y-17804) TaxID=698492 RepID=A0A0E9NGZ8_SAICN|nr:Metallo-dependent phosphatase [Saitoella complicata NRRL Y-17804]ODQ51925.1 Metallo-dependent phosphatase [Saitoella complicata NRRL Y-17804]GAO48685.1 hypothetical protein G7K_2855-t1 [Saitoella complicata NRRL Y-17804]
MEETMEVVLCAVWVAAFWYGESRIYRSAVRSCQWSAWEQQRRSPHHIAVIADPQIIDENTYTRRGLLLSLSKFFTDLYMHRNYLYLHSILHPSTTVFLGDLMDGGREWGDEVWVPEYERLLSVFPNVAGENKVYMNLPGNHDIGVADTIPGTALARFTEFFGQTSTEISIGSNHSLVLLDTVSLSNTNNPAISAPPRQFLDTLAAQISTESEHKQRVLFTHIPLYRDPDTPCGPLRESRSPIKIQKGYQYQNVILPDLSLEILSKIKPSMVFSGDDHDYCRVTHTYDETNTVDEVTVKSFSWAMGVHRPGFQLLSLDPDGGIETHLCLLPDPLVTFQCYGILAFVTQLALVVRGILVMRNSRRGSYTGLPTNADDDDKWDKGKKQDRVVVGSYLQSLGKVGTFAAVWFVVLVWWQTY